MGGSGSYCGYKGRWRRARLGLRPVGTWSSPRQPLMAPTGGSGRGQQVREELALWRLLYSGSMPTLLRWVENRRVGHGQDPDGARAAQTDRAPARASATRGSADSRGPRRACPSREGALPRGKGGLGQCSAPGGAGRRYGAARVRLAGSTSRRGWSSAENIPTRQLWASFSPKIWTEVHKVMNRKVVDLTALYIFYKGCTVFFSTDFA
jgi:hypothetical protein